MRASIDSAAMYTAHIWASRGTCSKKKIGAVVITDHGRVAGVGYNGAPSGSPHCEDVGCMLNSEGDCRRTVHAELNALIDAGNRTVGSTLYTTHFPCEMCATAAVAHGVVKVVYHFDRPYDERRQQAWEILKLAGVELEHFEVAV